MQESMQIEFAEQKDAEAISEIYGLYVENTAISFETEPVSSAEMGNRMRSMQWCAETTDFDF